MRIIIIFTGIILGITIGGRAEADLVVNGGFETGDFTGWTLAGDPTESFVDTGFPHSGLFNAELGQVGSLASLSQVINTTAGTNYIFSFWFAGSGDNPSEFRASLGGNPLLDLVNPPTDVQYRQYSYNFTANTDTTLIEFQFRDDVFFMQLDDVSVIPVTTVPEPASMIIFGIGIAALANYTWCRRKSKIH